MLFSDFQIIYLSEIFLSYLMCIHFESYLFSLSIAVLFLRLQVLVTSFGELGENEYLDPRTAQVAIVDHVKQVSSAVFKKSCTSTSYVNKKVLMTHDFFYFIWFAHFYVTFAKLAQVCTEVRPATDEELPSAYVEEFRYPLLLSSL